MRILKKIILILILLTIAVMLKEMPVFAEYVIQVVPTSGSNPAWTNISASDAYDACQNLNQSYSTLGTTTLKAHMSTNADWYAVSLLTYSAYGNSTANQKGTNTTGNKTGIMNLGSNWNFTGSLMDTITSSNENIASLYTAKESGSPYVESVKNNTNRASNAVGRGLLSNEYLSSSYESVYYADLTGYPVCTRKNLFGFSLGSYSYGGNASGAANAIVTFRPVLWNK